MEVKIKDRKKDVEMLRMALCMSEIWVDYQQADGIMTVLQKLEEKKEQFTLYDGVEIFRSWKKKWEQYFNKLNSETTKK